MGARQEDVSGAMMSILKKMDSMLETTNQIYNEQLVVLSSINTVQKTTVVNELKSQTKILQSIDKKIGAQASGSDIGNTKAFKEAFGDVGSVIIKLLKATKKLDDKKSEQISKFFTSLAKSVNQFVDDVDSEKLKTVSDSIKVISGGILKYSLTMMLATPLLILSLPGAFLFGLSIRLILKGAGAAKKDGIKSIEAVLSLSKGILLYVIAMLAVTLAMPIVLAGTLVFVGTLLLLSLGLKAIQSKDSRKGVLTLLILSGVIFALGLVIALFNTLVTWEAALKVGAVVGGLGLITYLIGNVATTVLKGAIALIAIGISLLIFSIGFSIFAKAVQGVTWEHIGIMGAVIGTMALIGTVLGIPPISGFAAMGAGVLILLGAAFTIFSVGFLIFAKAVSILDKDDPEIMGDAIYQIGKSVAKVGFMSPLVILGAGALVIAGAALYPIAKSLKIFKDVGFTSSDGDNLEYVVGSVAKAFGIITDKDRQRKMGFNVSPWDLFIGIQALSGAGRVLAGLAQGVQAWANLEVNEWEVVNGGTADAKLVIKNKRKLNDSDFENAALGMAKVITAIASPFAMVGRLEQGQSSGNPILDAVFSGGFVSKGIKALRGSGDTIVSLAAGVQAFANLEIMEFEVVNAGTSDAKLVPKGTRKLSDTDFTNAGLNISKILTVVSGAFAKIGKDEDSSSGIFSGGFVSKGVKSLAGVGSNVAAISDAIIKFATGEIPQFKLINAGTADAKLVPTNPLKLTPAMMKKAAKNIGDVISVLGKEVNKYGKWVDDNGDYIEDAVDSMKDISGLVKKSAESLIAWEKIKDPSSLTTGITGFMTSVKDIFNPKKNKDIGTTSWYFSKFTDNIETISDQSKSFDKIANNYDKIQKSMKLMKGHINSMDLKKLTLTDSMFKSIAAMAKNPEAIAKMVGETMEKSFEELIKALSELKSNSGSESKSIIERIEQIPIFKSENQVAVQQKPQVQQRPQGPSTVMVSNWEELAELLARMS